MIKPQKGWGRKTIAGLLGLVLSVLPGCFKGGSIGAYVGSHAPSSQNQGVVRFDNSTETGIRARAKTKSKVEVEVAYSGHETSYENAIQRDELEVKDLSVSASYPVWSNRTISVNVGAGAVSRSENQTGRILGVPGSVSKDRTSTGWRAGVEARWQPHKNVSVEAGLDFHGFGDGSWESGSYEKSGTTLSVGASYNF